MEEVSVTYQRAGKHFALLEGFLPESTLKPLSEKFPTEYDVDQLFEKGCCLFYQGKSYSVRLEWQQDRAEEINGLFMYIWAESNRLFIPVLFKNPTLHSICYLVQPDEKDSSKVEQRSKPKNANAVFLERNFEVFLFSNLMKKGSLLKKGSLSSGSGSLIEARVYQSAHELLKEKHPDLLKIELVAKSTTPKLPVRKIIAPLVIGLCGLAALYCTIRFCRWAFSHFQEAKASSTFEWSRIKSGDLSQVDPRIVLITSIAVGLMYLAAPGRSRMIRHFKLLTAGMIMATGILYYRNPERFNEAIKQFQETK